MTTTTLQLPGSIVPFAAAQYGGSTALVTTARTLTYAELEDAVLRVANGLLARGVEPGDRVSLYSANRWEWIVAYHAALRIGAVVNPINVMLTPEEVRYVLRDCGAKVLFGSAETLGRVPRIVRDVESLDFTVCFDSSSPEATDWFGAILATPADFCPVVEVDPRSASTIGYTSGTTGHPKGAVQSHQAVIHNCESTRLMHDRGPDDVLVTALPAPHVYGNVVINSTFLAGGKVVLMERFDAEETLRLIVEHRATMFEGVPAMYAMMLAHPNLKDYDLTSVTRSTGGGQTIPVPTIEAWMRATEAPLIEMWGMTELSGIGTSHWHDKPLVLGSVGVALPNMEIRIADLEDPTQEAKVGEAGEFMVRGPLVMLGYYGNERATAETIDLDGWLHTGDIAKVDEEGHVFIVDRRKDLIITAGFNVYPAEIERVIAGHPAVGMVAVGAIPDDVKGELACAYIVLREGSEVSSDEIVAFARERLAAYKVPRAICFVDSLPQTSSGKVMRRKLIELRDPN